MLAHATGRWRQRGESHFSCVNREKAHSLVVRERYREFRPSVEQDAGICQQAIPPDLPLSLEAACAEEDLPKGLWSKGDEGDPVPTSLLDALANSVVFSTGQEALDLDWVQLERLGQALAALPSRHRQALELRYRIGEEQCSGKLRPRREIGELMGTDQESVRRLEEQAERAIRYFFRTGTTGLSPASWSHD